MVDIPVVIDIDAAFEEAAKRVSTAIRPFQQSIEDETAKISLKIGEALNINSGKIEPVKRSLRELLTGIDANGKRAVHTIEELSTALEYAKERLAAFNASQQQGFKVDPGMLNGYREAITLLTATIEQRQHEGDIIAKTAERQIAATRAIEEGNYALLRSAKTMAEMNDRISALKGKLDNLDPKSAEWTKTAKEIEKTTAEVEKLNQKLGALSTKPGSIKRISAEMSTLREKWESMSRTQKFDKDGNLTNSAQKLIQKYRELTDEAKKFGKSIEDYANRGNRANFSLLKTLNKVTSAFGVYLSVRQLTKFVARIKDVTAELEYQRVALGKLIQDEEYGSALFERIKAAAIESPFRIKDLVTYTKQLAAYRIEQENLFDTTKRLADISAGLGVDMNRLILAFGQVRAASVLRGQELRQFTEAGIPLVELLAEKFRELGREGTTTADVFKLISQRAVPFSMIAEIFEDLTDKGGMFYKMQEEQAKTLKGRWEKLKDAYDVALQAVGESNTFQSYNDIILSVLTWMAKNLNVVVRLAESLGFAWMTYRIATAGAITATTKATAAIIKQSGAMGLWRTAMAGATTAWKNLTRALSANWVGFALSAIVGLITYFTQFRKKVTETTSSVEELNKAIEDIADADKAFNKINMAIDRYEKLAEKTNKTSQENVRLNQTMTVLREAFPGLTSSIDANSESLAENVGLLRKAAELQHGLAVDKAMEQYTVNAVRISEMQENLEKLQGKQDEAYRRLQYYKDAEGKGTIMERQRVKMLNKEAAEYERLNGEIDKSNTELGKYLKIQERLEKYLDPEKAAAARKEWQNILINMREYESEGVMKELFTVPDVEGWESLGDALKKMKPLYEEAKRSYEAYQETIGRGSVWSTDWEKEAEDAEKRYNAFVLIDNLFGGALSTSRKLAHQEDPFISILRERMKFMQDYKKGYEDLRKYLGSDGALEEESKNMRARGMALGLSADEQKRAATNLAQWYADMREEAFAKAKKHGATGTMDQFLSQEIKGTGDKSKTLREFQKLIQSLWDAETDINVSDMKKSFEDALKRLSDEIRRSEAARNFYKNMLDLTGDEDLAANMAISIYGTSGDDLADQMREQLSKAFVLDKEKINADGLDLSDVRKKVKSAIETGDTKELNKYLKYVVDENKSAAEEVVKAWENTEKEELENYARFVTKYADLETKRIFAKLKFRKQEKEAEKAEKLLLSNGNLTDEEKGKIKGKTKDAIKLAQGELDVELLKLSDEYMDFFGDINILSARSAREFKDNYIESLRELVRSGHLSASQFRKEEKAIEQQYKKLIEKTNVFTAYQKDGWGGVVEQVKDYGTKLNELSAKLKEGKEPTENEEGFLDRMMELYKLFSGKKGGFGDADSFGGAIGSILGENGGDRGAALSQMGDLFGEMGSKFAEVAGNIQAVSSDINGAMSYVNMFVQITNNIINHVNSIISKLDEVASEQNKIGAKVFSSGNVWKLYSDVWSEVYSSWQKLQNQDLVGGLVDYTRGIIGVYNWAQSSWNKILDKGIDVLKDVDTSKYGSGIATLVETFALGLEGQQELVEELDYQYGRLENSSQKAFGSDYIANYNKQLDVLTAKQEAYNRMAALEAAKEKSSDEEKVKEYQKQARDVADQIADMQGQLAEYFTGTDLTSAAKDFASAWLDAYKEFGSTTDAMKEKFQSMLQEMATNSLAAKVMQTILEPLFKQIDEMALTDNELSAMEIAQIAKDSPEYIERINTAMTSLMNELAAAGYNIRQQPGQFTGIKRNIANATEESVNGLTQAMNVNNFYMSTLPTISANVAQILAIISGGTADNPSTGASYQLNNELAIGYLSALPSIDEKMATMLLIMQKFEKTISDKNSATNLNVIAVRA